MLCERIYELRRKSGLSQEQLAERVGVSRQSISKWESGVSTPELEKVMALSECFGVTLDELVKEQPQDKECVEAPLKAEGVKNTKISETKIGIVLCLIGAVCLILSGITVIAAPGAAERINAASAVTLSGTGIMFAVCVIFMLIGMILILRQNRR